MIRKLNFWLVVFTVFISACKSQDVFLNDLNSSLVSYLKDSSSYQDDLKEYLDDNIKHITKLRKDFFELVDVKKIKKANLIENFDKSNNNLYNAFLQIDSDVYVYDYFIAQDSSEFSKIDIKTFRNNKISYNSESCILSKMMNNDLEDLLDDTITTNFHYTIYITSINEGNFKIHSLKDICW